MTHPATIAVEHHPEGNAIKTLFRSMNGRNGSSQTLDEACLRQALEMVRNSSVIDEAYELAIHYLTGHLTASPSWKAIALKSR